MYLINVLQYTVDICMNDEEQSLISGIKAQMMNCTTERYGII